MPCATHDWLFDSTCPKCQPPVTAPVTEKRGADRYSKDPVESAEQRKAEYAADEERGLV